jgi:CubicO group peptidase (beta-lactamase class C family)
MGGFPNLPPDWPIQQWGDWDGTIARVCALPLEFNRARRSTTARRALDMAEIVRRLDGAKRSFAESAPTGLPPAEDEGLPQEFVRTCGSGRPETRRGGILPFSMEEFDLPEAQAAIPGGGSRSTIFDLARFYQMWLNGGELDGVRLLSPAMVSSPPRSIAATEDRLLELLRVMNGWPPHSNRGLGWWIRGAGIFELLRLARLAGTFGHAAPRASWLGPIPPASSCSSG